jgi:formamidopyrimidine-DNA glycosylase
MIFHLGMSGRWRIDPAMPDKHDHLLLEAGGHVFALNDPRRFGYVDLVETARLGEWPAFAVMGPEPLGEGLDAAHLKGRWPGARKRSSCCCSTSGSWPGWATSMCARRCSVGGIDPAQGGGQGHPCALERLVPAIRAVLIQSIEDGGSTLRDYARPDGELGYFATRFAVYGREGQPCQRADGGTVRRIVQGGRSTWYCPVCQK